MSFLKAPLVALLIMCAGSLAAHEFWIAPKDGQLPMGAPVIADLKVGDGLDGQIHSYNPHNFRRFDIALGETIQPVEGQSGDRPALNMPLTGEGLAIAVHVTRDYDLTYESWDVFKRFTDHKDATWAQDRHKARGFSPVHVRERYSRHAKSLIAIGHGKGADRAFGLEVEFVALGNPYNDDPAAGLNVLLLYQGAPLADAQIELLDQAPDGTVRQRFYRTDNSGQVSVPVTPGHFHLIDHVVMRELNIEGAPHWESLWASLTFLAPDD